MLQVLKVIGGLVYVLTEHIAENVVMEVFKHKALAT